MSSIDYLIIVVVVISALIGIWRGFVREALSLVVWVAAFWLAYLLAGTVESYFAGMVSEQPLRLVMAFVLIFLTVHVVGFVVARLLSSLLESIGLGGVNRVVGGGFGIARGVLMVAVVVLVFSLTPMVQSEWWQGSYLVGLFVNGLDWLQHYYPLDLNSVFSRTRT